MSWIYERMLLDLSVNDDSLSSHNPPEPPTTAAKMDKSVFARVLKVVIQCVEEGSALLHTFKMEGDIINTRITIEFQSHFQPPSRPGGSSSPSTPSSPGRGNSRSKSDSQSPASRGTDRSLTNQSYPPLGSQRTLTKGPGGTKEDEPYHRDSGGGEPLEEREVVTKPKHSLGNGQCVRDKVSTMASKSSDMVRQTPPHSPIITPKKSNIPNGATPRAPKDKADSKKTSLASHSMPQTIDSIETPPASSKKGRKGAMLDQVISDQNRIPASKGDQDLLEMDEEQPWALDRNQNTVQRKNQNPSVVKKDGVILNGAPPQHQQNRGHVPIDVNVIVDNDPGPGSPSSKYAQSSVLPKNLGTGVQACAQIVNHPSLITRLAKISERGNDSEHGYGSSDEDSFDSDESIEMVTDTRQFGRKTKKYAKKRKGLISL